MLRATQFHALVDHLFTTSARMRVLPAGACALQPIDTAVVARAWPSRCTPDRPGAARRRRPAVQTLGELAAVWRATHGRRLPTIPLPLPPKFGRPLRAGVLCTAQAAAVGTPDFAQWLGRESDGVAGANGAADREVRGGGGANDARDREARGGTGANDARVSDMRGTGVRESVAR